MTSAVLVRFSDHIAYTLFIFSRSLVHGCNCTFYSRFWFKQHLLDYQIHLQRKCNTSNGFFKLFQCFGVFVFVYYVFVYHFLFKLLV